MVRQRDSMMTDDTLARTPLYAAPPVQCDGGSGEANLREQLHYLTGTCELAMKHRDVAEKALTAILKENCSGPIEVDRWLALLERAETAEARLAALTSPAPSGAREALEEIAEWKQAASVEAGLRREFLGIANDLAECIGRYMSETIYRSKLSPEAAEFVALSQLPATETK